MMPVKSSAINDLFLFLFRLAIYRGGCRKCDLMPIQIHWQGANILAMTSPLLQDRFNASCKIELVAA